MEKQMLFSLVITLAALKEVDVTGRDLLKDAPATFQGLLAAILEPEVEKRFSLKCIQ